jgi:hypothetical protein
MRRFLTILSVLVTTVTFGQTLSDKYLHYKTDYYWDTTLYKSEQAYYYDLTSGKITEKTYPVLQYMFTNIISDSPLVTKDTFERRGWSDYPYKYVKNGNGIYLQYFDLGKRKLRLNKEYSLNQSDTVKWLADKNSLDSKDGISVSGFSIFLGEETIEINGKQFRTFRFLEDHDQFSSHPSYYTKEVFLEQKNLIPIKFVTIHYDYKTRRKLLYSSVTVLASSGNILPDYTKKTTDDLVLYENKSTMWSERQKQVFLSMFASDMKQYAECLLKKLDGHISFYGFEQNMYFKRLVVSKECE